jgi:beta-galactosidase
MYGLKRKPFLLMESCPSATNWRSVAKLHRPGVHILQSMQAIAHGSDSVQYFQMRKGRGACEKFHGAVVDHEGTENTRVFAEIAALGEILREHADLVGTTKPAQVALIHDYQNGWAIADLKGALQSATGYVKTVQEHYAAFWKMGVEVAVQDETACLDGFKLVVAPMAYMLREGFAQRVRDYVHTGGVFVATYMTGYANDSDLCFTGGFPGLLQEVLGIWEEELDALYPEDTNALLWNNKNYPVHELCGLIHTRGAETLGLYAEDFYAGRPALTVNQFGAGKAYYMAARTRSGEADFLLDFYQTIARELNIRQYEPVPGVSIQSRESEGKRTVFLLNFTPEEKKFLLENKEIVLQPHGFAIVNGSVNESIRD